MEKENKLKILLGIIYLSIVAAFLLVFFNHFSFQDFSSYELLKNNRDSLNEIKNSNLFITISFFLLFCIVWCLLLGFASPIYFLGGFIFGKWIGTILVVLGLSFGATVLYLIGNYFFKNLIEKKFSSKYYKLTEKIHKNEFFYFVLYRAVGGIPFFLQNLLPILFRIKLKNYFIGSVVGLFPQLFAGTSLGAGFNKLIENNQSPPTLFDIILAPEVYLPILGIIILLILSFILREKFFN